MNELIEKFNDMDVTYILSENKDDMYLDTETIAQVFNTTRQNISYHLNQLDDSMNFANNTCKIQLKLNSGTGRLRTFYNLDVVIEVGYRVKSPQAREFRNWANNILKQYMLAGFERSTPNLDKLSIEFKRDGFLQSLDNSDKLLRNLRKVKNALYNLADVDPSHKRLADKFNVLYKREEYRFNQLMGLKQDYDDYDNARRQLCDAQKRLLKNHSRMNDKGMFVKSLDEKPLVE